MVHLKNKQHLFFDLDDTLWDFQKNSETVLRELFNEYRLHTKLNTEFEIFHQTYKRINQGFWSRYYKKQMDKQFLRNERFNQTFLEFGYDNYDENLLITEEYLDRAPRQNVLKDGCLEVLGYLKQNYKLHIITNGFKEVQYIKLDGCGIKSFFENIIISEEHALVKPDEKIFRLAEHLAGAKTQDCVMIGDSLESDIEGALNAGWEAIHLSESTNLGAVMQVKDLSELKYFF